MNIHNFRGVFVAAPTFFKEDGNVDTAALRKLEDYLLEEKLSGIFILSSTGEYFAMSRRQRIQAVRTIVEEADGRMPVFTMVSDASLSQVKENIHEMESEGADALVLTAPYYYKYSMDELETFFSEAAEISSKPVILYNQPARLPNSLSEPLVEKLSQHPNIAGLKDTSSDASRVGRLASFFQKREDFIYYAGSESLAGFAALCGANFVYALACVDPKLFLDIRKSAAQNDVAGVMRLQHRVDILCQLFSSVNGGSAESFNNFCTAIKCALELKGIGKAYPAQMGSRPSSEAYHKVKNILEQEDVK